MTSTRKLATWEETVLRNTKSAGHIGFSLDRALEYFEVSGQVYTAGVHLPLADASGTRRHGRWECTRAHFDMYRERGIYQVTL